MAAAGVALIGHPRPIFCHDSLPDTFCRAHRFLSRMTRMDEFHQYFRNFKVIRAIRLIGGIRD
jgi:hypothetical protein